MATIVEVTQAPSTFLNLKIGVTYAPRVLTPGFVGYVLAEPTAGRFELYAYDGAGGGAVLWEGEDVGEAWHKLAIHLGY